MGETIYLSVAANIKPEENIPLALEQLSEQAPVTALSTFYRCPALDRPEQDDYLNGVCGIETGLSPRALKFEVLRGVEERVGRVRQADPYAAREIDLDILVYGDEVVDEADLRIPDPDIVNRAFLAVPLLELAPELVLPDSGKPLASLAAAQARQGLVPQRTFTSTLRLRLSL